MTVVFPQALRSKGTIGIVSPSRWPEREWIDKAEAFFRSRGYNVVVHAQNYLQEGRLAGSDAARAEAIHDMFADRTIDAIVCARGGTGALRLIDLLDYKLIGKNPKPFVGFSDATVLLHAIKQRCGFITYHGPMGWNFAQPANDERTGADLLSVIGTKKKSLKMHYPEVKCRRAGKAEGVLAGGNMTLLQNLIGTPYDWTAKDAILFIEDVGEPLYKIDNRLKQFRLAGKFRDVRAVLVGEMVDLIDGEPGDSPAGEVPYGRTLERIVEEHVPPGVPLAFNFPCGHGKFITTLPLGARVQIALSARGAELAFATASAVQ